MPGRMLLIRTALIAVFCAAVAAGAHSPAVAGIVVASADNGLVAPDRFTSFSGSGLADSAAVTTEFSGDGYTFAGGVRFRTCGASWPNGAGGWTPDGYVGNNGPGCVGNVTDDTFSVFFDGDAAAASFTVHSLIQTGATIRLQALLDGAVVDSLDLTDANDSWCCAPDYVRIDGIVFDQLRFLEVAPSVQSWIVIDNLAYNEALAVPEPPLPVMFGAAFLALFPAGSRRFRRILSRA